MPTPIDERFETISVALLAALMWQLPSAEKALEALSWLRDYVDGGEKEASGE